jgi:hypothetical protein
MNIIKNFIKKKKRLVYGGMAINELVSKKSIKDAIYTELHTPDIEFYSPKPVHDLIELCDILHKKKIKYVVGKEGIHNETFKIFCNFENYCDIGYMPENLYKAVPTVKLDGLYYIDTEFMMIDIYRVYTDPLTSYWRLEKTFTRTARILKHYPLRMKKKNNINEKKKKYYKIKKKKKKKRNHSIKNRS